MRQFCRAQRGVAVNRRCWHPHVPLRPPHVPALMLARSLPAPPRMVPPRALAPRAPPLPPPQPPIHLLPRELSTVAAGCHWASSRMEWVALLGRHTPAMALGQWVDRGRRGSRPYSEYAAARAAVTPTAPRPRPARWAPRTGSASATATVGKVSREVGPGAG